MRNSNGKKRLTSNLQVELIKFLYSIKSPARIHGDLVNLAKLLSGRVIEDTDKDKVITLLALIFMGVYPQLQTKHNRELVVEFLMRMR